MKSVSLIAFGTFGNPNGFTETFFAGSPIGVKTFDIRGSILVYPNSRLYSIRKEYKDGHNMIAYAVYTYAKEPTSARGGSFIGSSLLFIDKIAEENITIRNLDEFHENLITKNVNNDTITVNHSKNFNVNKPADFDKIEYHLKEIKNLNFTEFSNKTLVVYCITSPDKLQTYFQKSIDLLNVYDTIYFTQSKEVAEFVRRKSIFKLVEADRFENEIQSLQAKRKRKIEDSISEFEKEISRLDEDKNKTLDDFKKQIEKNEQIHQENEKKINESKDNLDRVKLIYSDFSNKIKDYTNQLKSYRKLEKLEDVKRLYNENKQIFINSVKQIKRPDFINAISEVKVNTGVRNSPEPIQQPSFQGNTDNDKVPPPTKTDIFKVTSVILLLLCIVLLYFLIFKNDKKQGIEPTVNTEQSEVPSNEPEQVKTSELNPVPQSELNEHDCHLIAKKLSYDTKIDDVVTLIFKTNPNDIKKIYTGQEEIYGKVLIEKNKDCFQDRDGIYYFVQDTLKHIPSK